MRVRDALLALLARGPAHGYKLKVDHERLVGSRAMNVGQIYSTLERLQRDGLVERGGPAGEDRRVEYRLTELGHKTAVAWLGDPGEVPRAGRSVVAGKVLLALGVPGIDIREVIDAHRLAFLAAIRAIRHRRRSETLDLEQRLAVDADVAVAEAELRWLDLCEAEITTADRKQS